MAFSLPLSPPLRAQGWKVKIRDRERSEPPHVTILHRTRAKWDEMYPENPIASKGDDND
jgi:hypothetical protein